MFPGGNLDRGSADSHADFWFGSELDPRHPFRVDCLSHRTGHYCAVPKASTLRQYRTLIQFSAEMRLGGSDGEAKMHERFDRGSIRMIGQLVEFVALFIFLHTQRWQR
jgi:hypothetical protein